MGGALDLRYVHVVARHGDRTSLHKLPNQPQDAPVPACRPAHIPVEALRRFTVAQPRPGNAMADRVSRKIRAGGYSASEVSGSDWLSDKINFASLLGPGAAPLPIGDAGCDQGMLTSTGVKQHSSLGRYFRMAYQKLLPSQLSSRSIVVESTDYSRTVLSAVAQVLGMYPLSEWPASLASLPLYIRARSVDESLIGAERFARVHCPRAAMLKGAGIDEVRRLKPEALKQELCSLFGISAEELPRPAHVADVLYARLCHGDPLPCYPSGCISSAAVSRMLAEADYEYSMRYNITIASLQMQPMLQRILSGMMENVHGGETVWRLSTTHDIAIAPILSALHAFDGRWPSLASHIAFELWGPPKRTKLSPKQTTAGFRVRVLFNGADVTHRLPCSEGLHGPATSELCSLAGFGRFISGMLPSPIVGVDQDAGKDEGYPPACALP